MVYFLTLMKNDIKNILRDRFLIYAAIAAPIMFIVLGRLVFPWISENYYFIEPFYPAFFMLFVIFVPLIFGFITGFLIMDDRDENLLTVLRVMPISRSSYLIYRMVLMIILAFIYVSIFPWLTGLVEVSYLDYLPIAALFAIFTPVMGIVVNIIASNKVQAFAIFKTLGGVFIIPIFALAITDNVLKYIFGIIPNFWTFMALENLLVEGTNDFVFIGIGFVYHIALLAVLFHLFNKKF